MRKLDELRLADSPDHEIIDRPWDYDIREFQCWWSMGDAGLTVEIEMSSHEEYVTLRFTGVFDLNGVENLHSAIRIIDAKEFLPEVMAPIRVQHPKGGGFSFWAESVDLISTTNTLWASPCARARCGSKSPAV